MISVKLLISGLTKAVACTNDHNLESSFIPQLILIRNHPDKDDLVNKRNQSHQYQEYGKLLRVTECLVSCFQKAKGIFFFIECCLHFVFTILPLVAIRIIQFIIYWTFVVKLRSITLIVCCLLNDIYIHVIKAWGLCSLIYWIQLIQVQRIILWLFKNLTHEKLRMVNLNRMTQIECFI